MTIREMHRKPGFYTELRALEANAIEERFRAFAPRWLEGIEIEFDGIRGQPQLDRLDIPEPGNTALPRRTTIYLTGQTTPGTPAFTWRYAAAFGSSVLRVQRAGQKRNDQLLAKRRYAKRADPRNRCTGAIFIGRV